MPKLTRLRHFRERAALSQQDLAQQAGVSRSALARIELGEVEPRPSTLRKLAAALNVQPAELMEPAS